MISLAIWWNMHLLIFQIAPALWARAILSSLKNFLVLICTKLQEISCYYLYLQHLRYATTCNTVVNRVVTNHSDYGIWHTVWLRFFLSYVKRRTYYPPRLSCLQIELEFVVTDDQGATAFLRPIINLCACHNNGVCLHSVTNKNSTYNSNKMNVLECGCLNGYTGTFCESDLDACEANLNPCYPGVKCIDLPPPANISGYKCGPCPNGFTGDGSKCRGIHHQTGLLT